MKWENNMFLKVIFKRNKFALFKHLVSPLAFFKFIFVYPLSSRRGSFDHEVRTLYHTSNSTIIGVITVSQNNSRSCRCTLNWADSVPYLFITCSRPLPDETASNGSIWPWARSLATRRSRRHLDVSSTSSSECGTRTGPSRSSRLEQRGLLLRENNIIWALKSGWPEPKNVWK